MEKQRFTPMQTEGIKVVLSVSDALIERNLSFLVMAKSTPYMINNNWM